MRCERCGGPPATGVTWCGQCYARVPAPYQPAAPPLALAVAVAPYAMPAVDLAPPAPVPRRAGVTTIVAIAVGALLQWVVGRLLDGGTFENEALVRYGIVTVLAIYSAVGYLVHRRIAADAHPLRWRGTWGAWPSAAFGLAVGGAAAFGLLRLLESHGVEGGDQYVALLVSERTVPYIGVAFLIAAVAAPLVEEALFRGLLLESWLARGKAVALLGSAAMFAAWHLSPAQLPYYTVAGALLGLVYLRHGLAGSMAAHAAFNGTLVVAAVLYAFAPGPVVNVETSGLTLRAPSGWHTIPDAPAGYLYGPSNAVITVDTVSSRYYGLTPAELVARIQLDRLPALENFEVRADTAYTVELPSGEAARVTATQAGLRVDLVLLPVGHRLHFVALRGAGSTRARADFGRVLQSIEVDR
ncbi:MAG TPA: type II CAAX endopeptidase family protein [Frankiaceae bacterium]|nr:type II CAAX endopeptidase family protein [Frankiaceae bacterium]